MEERLGLVVSSVEQLAEKLTAFVSGAKEVEGVRRGRVEPDTEGIIVIGRDEDMQQAIEKWIARRKLAPLLDLWVRGLDVDFGKLHGDVKPRRISLPTYPFAKTRCWIDETRAHPDTDLQITCDAQMKSIEEIINQIAEDTIDTSHAVQALRTLV
jgi:polyketide synthase PksN